MVVVSHQTENNDQPDNRPGIAIYTTGQQEPRRPSAHVYNVAWGGIIPGFAYGQTDELSYFVVENKMTVRDLQAMILHLLGLDPYRLSRKFQGLDAGLIGPTDDPRVVTELLA